MRFDFLTPEAFNTLIVLNLIVGVLLYSLRFYWEMTHPRVKARQTRQQQYDESSYDYLADTDLGTSESDIAVFDEANEVQQSDHGD